MATKKNIPLLNLIFFSLLGAILIVAQISLRLLPNIELVSILIFIYAKYYRFYSLLPVYIFIFIEGIIYGFGLWWLCYLYVWLILVLLTIILTSKITLKNTLLDSLICAITIGFFGLIFGFLFSISYMITIDFKSGITYFISGIIFDIIHFVSNFIIGMVLYIPLNKLFNNFPFLKAN